MPQPRLTIGRLMLLVAVVAVLLPLLLPLRNIPIATLIAAIFMAL